MKKYLALILALVMVFTLCACGSTEDNSDTADVNDDSIEVDEKLLTVEITMPAEFCEDITQDELDADVEDGIYKSATLNEDGSVTYVMTKAQHKKALKKYAEELNQVLADMPASEEYPNIVSVESNDTFTEFKVVTTNTELDLNESFSTLLFYMCGGMYNAMADEEIDNINVKFYNAASGNIIEEANSSDLADDSTTDMVN